VPLHGEHKQKMTPATPILPNLYAQRMINGEKSNNSNNKIKGTVKKKKKKKSLKV
jgi:hypothetical protein